jgi:hypothetical protein
VQKEKDAVKKQEDKKKMTEYVTGNYVIEKEDLFSTSK